MMAGTRTDPIGGYIPSIPLAAIGLICYLVLDAIYWIRLKKQGYRYMLPICIGAATMALGFGIRFAVHANPTKIGPYIMQTMFILLSPCLFIAQNYILLPRLATAMGHSDLLFIRPNRVVRLFVWSDVITFWIQGSGGSFSAIQGNSTFQTVGKYAVLGGLALQCASFGLFLALLVVFGLRVIKIENGSSRMSQCHEHLVSPTPTSPQGLAKPCEELSVPRWKFFWILMCLSSGGILIRCVYRVIEYSQGYTGYIPTHEAFFYLFDSLPLFLAIGQYGIWWPPTVIGDVQKSEIGDGAIEPADMERRSTLIGRQHVADLAMDKMHSKC